LNQDIICRRALTDESLSSAVETFFRQIRPHRERLFDYYRGEQPVPKGEVVRGRPNNLLRVPFPRYITEVHTGYFLGVPPTLSFDRPSAGQAFSALNSRLRLEHLLFDVGRDLSICGAGFILTWLEQSGLKVCRCDPLSCFTLRSEEAGAPLLGAVRLYQTDNNATAGILYRDTELIPFTWDGQRAKMGRPTENLLRSFSLIPFSNNCQSSGDFEQVTGLVDAYNLLLSGAMDDMQSVANAFLALYGMQGTTQSDIDAANRSRVLSLAEGGRAEFVVKNLNPDALGQLENNLRRSILQLSMTPDLSDASFAGNTSGVALQYKLWGIEQIRSTKERSFKDGLQMLLSAFSGGLSLFNGSVDLTDAHITFYKNLPHDHTELANTMLTLSPVLSRQTILENLPWVENPEQELQRKEKELSEKSFDTKE